MASEYHRWLREHVILERRIEMEQDQSALPALFRELEQLNARRPEEDQ